MCFFFIYIYFIYLLVGSLVVIVIMVYIASGYIQDMLIVLCGCEMVVMFGSILHMVAMYAAEGA